MPRPTEAEIKARRVRIDIRRAMGPIWATEQRQGKTVAVNSKGEVIPKQALVKWQALADERLALLREKMTHDQEVEAGVVAAQAEAQALIDAIDE